MNADELIAFRDRLLRSRAELLDAGNFEVKVELDSTVASARDQDEAPLAEMGQAIASSRNRERELRLEQIDSALRRIAEDGDAFGLCEECGEPIPERRLLLMPYARFCVACQSLQEGPSRHTRKKITEYR